MYKFLFLPTTSTTVELPNTENRNDIDHLIEKKITLSTRRKPWVSSNIRALMHRRDCVYKIAKNSGQLVDSNRFRSLRATVKNCTIKRTYL